MKYYSSPPGLELEYLNTFGHIILNAVVGVESCKSISTHHHVTRNSTIW